jgi:hypothetical protein
MNNFQCFKKDPTMELVLIWIYKVTSFGIYIIKISAMSLNSERVLELKNLSPKELIKICFVLVPM